VMTEEDNITLLEREAILRSCLDCRLKCGTVSGVSDKDNVLVYGDPAYQNPTEGRRGMVRQSG